jgi:CRP-like cAMP-binding protein
VREAPENFNLTLSPGPYFAAFPHPVTHTFLKTIFKEENFTREQLETILSQYQRLEFDRGQYLVEAGTVAPFYFFLESGYTRSYVLNPEGDDISTRFFGPSDIVIDWHSYFLKTPCRENIQAITPCVAWKITFENFMKLFHIEAFREVGRTRLVNHFFELKTHTVSIIADAASDRYRALLENRPDIIQNVPLKQIATYLGITDTSLSRIRKELAQSK